MEPQDFKVLILEPRGTASGWIDWWNEKPCEFDRSVVRSCQYTTNVALAGEADAIVTHSRKGGTLRRYFPEQQLWAYSLESGKSDGIDKNPSALTHLNGTAGMSFNRNELYSDLIFKQRVTIPVTTHFPLDAPPTLEGLLNFSVVPVERREKVPVLWIASNCGVSQRQALVQKIMANIEVDRVGKCLNNKPLEGPPANKDWTRGLQQMSRYKFYLAFENSNCDGYVTEKYWRPLHIGQVPVVWGAPKSSYMLPSAEKSAIFVDDFATVKDLTDFLHYLDGNDTAFNEYLQWRKGPQHMSKEFLEYYTRPMHSYGYPVVCHTYHREHLDRYNSALLQGVCHLGSIWKAEGGSAGHVAPTVAGTCRPLTELKP